MTPFHFEFECASGDGARLMIDRDTDGDISVSIGPTTVMLTWAQAREAVEALLQVCDQEESA